MANCEGEIIPCDKNVINTFAHQHLKYDENEKYYIISLENFLFRSKILRIQNQMKHVFSNKLSTFFTAFL